CLSKSSSNFRILLNVSTKTALSWEEKESKGSPPISLDCLTNYSSKKIFVKKSSNIDLFLRGALRFISVRDE
ncbi:MAG: hypothetical protein KJ779_08635, partial [Firmicutes bacterium]|nr:hypothetical protein [Bacillota bacterium]